MSAPSLHIESTNSMILGSIKLLGVVIYHILKHGTFYSHKIKATHRHSTVHILASWPWSRVSGIVIHDEHKVWV